MLESAAGLLCSFPYAVITGVLTAAACSLLGVFVILKRVVFIGITLSEIAACGIALAFLAGLPPAAGAIFLTLAAVALLAFPFESRRIPRDAVMGVLFVAAASLSVLLVSGSGLGLREVKSLLYGELILASKADCILICVTVIPALLCLLIFLRPILYAFLDRETAAVLGVKPGRWELLFFLALGVVIATASKAAGALLVFCYLIVPPMTALLLSRRLSSVLLIACLLAIVETLTGLVISFGADLPTNQTICVAACVFLLPALPVAFLRFRRRHQK